MSIDKMIEEITGGSKPPLPVEEPKAEEPKAEEPKAEEPVVEAAPEPPKVTVKINKTPVAPETPPPPPEEEEDRELAALPKKTAERVRLYRAKMAARAERTALSARK